MAWWEGRDDERFWLEITDRPDLGVDLKAPQLGDNGRPFWSYAIVTDVRDGDTVFHYYKPDRAIIAVSRATGEAGRKTSSGRHTARSRGHRVLCPIADPAGALDSSVSPSYQSR
jgi:hypothetical protein